MLEKIVLTSLLGSSVEVYLLGSTITSFKTPLGQEMLFLSSKAVLTGEKPIRGGIPIAFPQFAAQGPLPMHGFARTSLWTLESSGDGFAELSLSDSEKTRELWNHSFRLVLKIKFDDKSLGTTLEVKNLDSSIDNNKDGSSTDVSPFEFEALLHTYLNAGIDGSGSLRIHGLPRGTTYIDKPSGGLKKEEVEEEVALVGEVDRIYVTPNTNTVTVSGIKSTVTSSSASTGYSKIEVNVNASSRVGFDIASGVHADGLTNQPADIVVWNAGPAKCASIADFGPDDWKNYVCIEPGVVSRKVKLEKGGVLTISQTIKFSE
jgi:glucose-6-phosphate 1-epimerase